MFDRAWVDYQTITENIKHNPGKDQNKVVEAMRSTQGLKWGYFSSDSAKLLDKIYKFEEKTFELGGEAALKIFEKKNVLAVHTTCYEQKSKVMGLKAANAFWNPEYYDPNRRTITKKLIYSNYNDFANEIRSLIYLAVRTERTLIIPNLLGDEKSLNSDLYRNLIMWPGFRAVHIRQKKRPDSKNDFQLQESEEDDQRNTDINTNDLVLNSGILSYFSYDKDPKISNIEVDKKNEGKKIDQNKLLKKDKNENKNVDDNMKKKIRKDLSTIKIVEPAYYWRIKRDYSNSIPDPFILAFIKGTNLRNIEESLLSSDIINIPRIVLHMDNSCKSDREKAKKNKIDKIKNIKKDFSNGYERNIEVNENNDKNRYNLRNNYFFNENKYNNIINKNEKSDYLYSNQSYNNTYITNQTLLNLLNNNIYLNLDLPKYTLNPIAAWTIDSVGLYRKFHNEHSRNIYLPKLELNERNPKKKIMDLELGYEIAQYVRPCNRILEFIRGNRSCFDKCQ